MEKVSSYQEYMDVLDGRGDVIVFRGQANSDFVLIPSGLRGDHIETADSQMFRFVDEMKKLFNFDELTCIEIAQHFALPTRMLDFSYSFDVALFFACHDEKGRYTENDGKVFIFNKSRYEQVLRERKMRSSEVIRNNKFLYEWLQKYIDKESTLVGNEEVDMPIFIDATQQFDRLYMQKGLFLLWGRDECPLEKILENEGIDMSYLIDTIVIDADAKPRILERLAEKHICEDTLYMNVGIIKNMVKNIKYGGKQG
ncbi:MAG: FRG domain-containing protein [Acetatifactor sp.]